MQTQEQTAYTMQDFIAEHGLTMVANPVNENPHMSDMPKGSRHFSCTITAPSGETVTTPYSVGLGIVDRWILDNWKAVHTREGFARRKDFERGTFTFGKRPSIHDHHVVEDVRSKRGPIYRPDIADVLDNLASDASCYENARSFEDFANDLGYDEDSRKAETIYRICGELAKRLRSLVGVEALDVLLYETERL